MSISSNTIVGLVLGVFGSLGTLFVVVKNLKSLWFIIKNMKWMRCWGSVRMKWLLRRFYSNDNDIIPLTRKIIWTTNLTTSMKEHLSDLLVILRSFSVADATQYNKMPQNESEQFDLSYICCIFLGETNSYNATPMNSTNSIEAWEVIHELIIHKVPQGMSLKNWKLYQRTWNHCKLILKQVEPDNTIILECIAELMTHLICEMPKQYDRLLIDYDVEEGLTLEQVFKSIDNSKFLLERLKMTSCVVSEANVQ